MLPPIRGKRARESAEAVTHGDLTLVLHNEVAEYPSVTSGSVAVLHHLEAVDVDRLRLAIVHAGETARDLGHAALVCGDGFEWSSPGLLLIRTPSRHMTRFIALEAGTLVGGESWLCALLGAVLSAAVAAGHEPWEAHPCWHPGQAVRQPLDRIRLRYHAGIPKDTQHGRR